MKKKLAVILPIFIVIFSTSVIAITITCRNLAEKRLYSSYYTLNENFIVECENGSFGKNKNTSEYIKTALQSGVNSIEVDLCFNKDGEPYIEEENEKINEKTVLLDKLLEFIATNTSYENISICLHLEKEASNLKRVDELVEKYSFIDRIYYTGISLGQAQYVRNQSAIPFYLSIDIGEYKTDDKINELYSLVSNSNAKGIVCDIDDMTEEIYNVLHENFIEITFDDIDKISDFVKIAKYTPTRIRTNNAYEILEVLHNWQNNAPIDYYN